MTDRSKAAQITGPTIDVSTDPLFASLFAEVDALEAEAEAAVADLLG